MRIVLNGKEVDAPFETTFELMRVYNNGSGEVVILNGYQLREDSVDIDLKEGDNICVIKKGIMPCRHELESMMSARHTPGVHKKLKSGKAAVAGLGGLGSHVSVMLARIGVGKLLLVDYDTVEPSNLNRQSYDLTHLGMFKTEALKRQIENINPFIEVQTLAVKVTEENAAEIFGDYAIVCEAFDNAQDKAMLVDVLLSLGDIKIVAASGMAGYGSANDIKTRRRLKNLYVCGDFETAAQPGIGLMSPRVEVCAGHQANMILRLLLDMEEE